MVNPLVKIIMNKQLLAITACMAMGYMPMSAVVTIDGNENDYASISKAMEDAKDGDVILVTESYLEETTINPGDKNITIKGSEGIVISYKGQYVVSLQNASCSLTLENLTFKNTLTSPNTRNTFAVGRGSLYITDVTIDGADVNNATGIISLNNGNSNIPNAKFDNLKIINSNITTAPAQVVVNNSNLSLSGDTDLSIQLKGANTIKSAEGFTGHATLVLDADRALNSVVVNNCTDPSRFTISGMDDKSLQVIDGNLVLAEAYPIVNETTGKGYTTLNDAIKEARNGEIIILNKDVTLSSRPTIGGKSLIITGATGEEKIIRGENFLQYLFLLNNIADNLTLDNLVIDGNNIETAASMLQPSAGASVTLSNVKIINCKTTNARGLIDNPTNNAGTWHLDGVEFTDCEVPNQHVTACAAGNSIKGNNILTLRINDKYTVDAAGIDNSDPAYVTFGSPESDQTAFTNCNDKNQFVCANDGYILAADGDNLILEADTTTGIDDITFDSTLNVRWFNLMGQPVTPTVPGLYIKFDGHKSTKVYVK